MAPHTRRTSRIVATSAAVVALALSFVIAGASPASADGCADGDGGYRAVSAAGVRGFDDTAGGCFEQHEWWDGDVEPLTSVAADLDDFGEWVLAARSAASTVSDVFDGVESVPSATTLVGIAPTRSGDGVWIADADGATFAYGDARYLGGMNGAPLEAPIVDAASVPTGGQGYWQVSSDGGVFAFGAAPFFGSLGDLALAAPIVDLVATPSGRGYWLVASDGGVFAFGDARFAGSAASFALTAPIVGLAATDSGDGYWLLGSDGGVFAFGAAPFLGRAGGSIPSGDAWFGIIS